MRIKLHVADKQPVRLSVPKEKPIGMRVFGEFYGNAAPYVGEYEYTPTQQTQTIPIGGYKATQNITINPIPNNYGLITWNGATLTVS